MAPPTRGTPPARVSQVARIRRFWQPADPATVTPENTTVEVSWFYRPEE